MKHTQATVISYPSSGPFVYFDKNNPRSPCKCAPNDYCPDQGGGALGPCGLLFDLTEDMPGPIYFFYTLSNFHQNHRRMVKSSSPTQVRATGDELTAVAESNGGFGNSVASCSVGEAEKYVETVGDVDVDIYYYPCGLLARSMFNDTFKIVDRTDPKTPKEVVWTDRGVVCHLRAVLA
jgi:hypothetical protein